MNFANLIKTALKAINNNKTRALLTMLGVIIGIASVILMMAAGEGVKSYTKDQISSMGTNLIMISPKSKDDSGVRLSSSDMRSLKISDYEAIRKECDYIQAVTPSFTSGGQAIYGSNNTPTTMYGVSEDYLTCFNYSVEYGVMFNDDQIKSMDKVCVLGTTVVEELFNSAEDAIGKVIRFGSTPMTVIGVLESKGSNAAGMDDDDKILAPYTTVQKRLLAIDYVPSINCSAVSSELSEKAVEEVEALLRQRHDIGPDENDDFEVNSMESILSTMDSVLSMLTLFLVAIAGISLVVGGIGIMNIMYVSVTERTKEIGLRLSIGAKGKYIMLQFLIESVIISVIGGVIGILIGCAISGAINLLPFNFHTSVSASSVIVSFLVCTLTGIFFGWYPSQKASQLDPIEALRYE